MTGPDARAAADAAVLRRLLADPGTRAAAGAALGGPGARPGGLVAVVADGHAVRRRWPAGAAPDVRSLWRPLPDGAWQHPAEPLAHSGTLVPRRGLVALGLARGRRPGATFVDLLAGPGALVVTGDAGYSREVVTAVGAQLAAQLGADPGGPVVATAGDVMPGLPSGLLAAALAALAARDERRPQLLLIGPGAGADAEDLEQLADLWAARPGLVVLSCLDLIGPAVRLAVDAGGHLHSPGLAVDCSVVGLAAAVSSLVAPAG